MEKHLVQRCTPCNSLALQYSLRPGRWGHAYLPHSVSFTAVEVYGQSLSAMGTGDFPVDLGTADSITLYGKGLHQAICSFAIRQVISRFKIGHDRTHVLISTMHDIENDKYPDLLHKLCSSMKAIISLYEACSIQGNVIVPDTWRSLWTDEFGHLRIISRPWLYNRDDIESWAGASVIAGGGQASRVSGQGVIIKWRGKEHSINDVHWWFEHVGYSPATNWIHPAMLVLAAAESAKNGGLLRANVAFTIETHGLGFDYNDHRTLTAAIKEVLAEDFRVIREVEPAGELVAGVLVLLIGKLAISTFCTFLTGGGPWLVVWLTTALSRWSTRDLGGMRQSQHCNGAGYHVHTNRECRLRFLFSTCLTSAGSEHSRVLGVITALCGWAMARIAYSLLPGARQLLEIDEWAMVNGFTICVASLIVVCAIGLVTISYKQPRTPQQRYYIWRIALEWGFAALAILTSMVPAIISADITTPWILLAEIAAWVIDAGMTLRVIGTYPNSITSWHSVWVLVPAILSIIGGVFGCW
jgi:hypothetical protein